MNQTPIQNGKFQPKKSRGPDNTPDNEQPNESDGPLSEKVKNIRKLRAAGRSEAEVHAAVGVPELASDDEPRPHPRPKTRQDTSHAEENALTFISLKDLFNTPDVKVDWLVDGLLPIGGLSLLVAKPKAGKSTLARNLALAVAQGQDFLGKPTQQGLVIYLALEEKLSEVKRHFLDMRATGDEPILTLAARVPASAFEQVCTVAERQHPSLIIVDPLFYLTRIRDGNDYAEVSRALAPFLALARETGAHVLCVHHAGKVDREGGDSIIGSTALFAAVDTAILLKRTDRYRTIRSIQRYGVDLSETVLSFDPQTRTVSLGATREQEEEARIAEAMLECLTLQESAEQGRPLRLRSLTLSSHRKESNPMSIYLRSKSYYYEFVHKGHRYRGSFGQVSRSVAKEEEHRKKTEVIEHRLNPTKARKSPRFDTFAEDYLDWVKHNRKPLTYRQAGVRLKPLFAMFGTKNLNEITAWHVEQYKKARKEAGRAPVTINSEIVFLKTMLNKAVIWKRLADHPGKEVKLLKAVSERTRFFSEEEERAIVARCSIYLRRIVETGLLTGFRPRELTSLRPEDVDLERTL